MGVVKDNAVPGSFWPLPNGTDVGWLIGRPGQTKAVARRRGPGTPYCWARIALDRSMNKFHGDLQRITIRPEVSRVVYETEMEKVEGGAEPKWAKRL
jgi:hypothetical protein